MKVYKVIFFLIASLILVISTGCSSNKQGPVLGTTPFLGGTNGVLINFAPNAPPEAVYDGGQYAFDIDVKLKNAGETFIAKENIRVKISGIHPPDFGKTSADLITNPDEDLEPTRKISSGETVEGTEAHVLFEGLNYLRNLSGNNNFPIRAEVCYLYKTLANSKMCVRENMIDMTKPGVCVVNEAKVVYSSRAPVQIVSFKETAMGRNKMMMEIAIRHDGNGRIFAKGTTCDSSLTNRDKVWVNVKSDLAGLKCSGLSGGTDTSGYAKLYNGEVVMTCTQQTDTQTDFEKIVEIELEYDYEDDKTVDILVRESE